jgi:hypothetical protein
VSGKESASQALETGVRDGIDLRIPFAQSPHVTKKLFLEYARDAAIPTVESNQDIPGSRTKPGVVFWDNGARHCYGDIFQEWGKHRIPLITYPPHTSPIIQVIDVMLFGRLKSAKKCLPSNNKLDPQVDHTMRVFRTYEVATAGMTVTKLLRESRLSVC